MKKFPGLCLFLSVLLALQLMVVPVWATEVETEDASQETQESSETVATEPVFTIPVNFTGDASVVAGCSTIDAAGAMISLNDLEVEAGAALMYELNTGTLLYAYNVDQQMYPASVTKVMTCLLALENGNMEDVVTVSADVVNNRDPNGSDADLKIGEELTMEQLLYCLMVASANDAGSAISEHIAGSEEAFVEMMNQKAQELGCTGTHFANPHGLHDENHYTTARDLAKILMAALEYDLFQQIYSTKTYHIPETNKHEARNLTSTNYMIENSHIEYYYDERVIGGKTGFTTPAGRCLVAVSESDGMKLLTVVLGGKTETDVNGRVQYYSFKETGKLIDYGFAEYYAGQILTPNAVLTSFPVSGGENNTQAVVNDEVRIAVPNELIQSQLRYEYILNDSTLTAPIEAGQELGVVRVWYQSKCIAQEEIYATVSSAVKQVEAAKDPAVGNNSIQENRDLWQIVLLIILILLGLIVVMIVISMIRSSIIRARRKKRRKNARRRR